MSVNELARRLGVTPSAVSQLERSEAEGTIKLNSLREALAAMGANLRVTAGVETPMSKYAPYRVAESMAESLLNDGDPTFALRLLTHATGELADQPESIDPVELDVPPTALPDKGWDTLMRASYAHAIRGSRKPAWTRVGKLAEPWFVSQFPFLRERAKTTTPDYLRRLNIFIDENSLSRR
jgi:transcriptional regulator with XRE-family HTH domain